jgi:hypothetical protein
MTTILPSDDRLLDTSRSTVISNVQASEIAELVASSQTNIWLGLCGIANIWLKAWCNNNFLPKVLQGLGFENDMLLCLNLDPPQ